MSINRLTIAVMTSLLFFSVVACTDTYRTESTGQYVDSSVLTTKVMATLANDPSVNSLPIKVKTYKRVVQLSGFADNAAEKRRAGYLVSKIPGVIAVKNNILVKH